MDYTKTKIPTRFGPLDTTGIPLFDPKFVRLKGKPVYHPIVIIQYGLANHDLSLEGNKETEKNFMNCADWLLDHAVEEPEKRFRAWYYPFRMLTPPVSPPWISGMAQGQALSLLARAYQIIGSSQFAQIAQEAAGSFRYEIQDGGIISKTHNGNYFIEELAYQPAIHILNGCLYAVFGLYEYLTVFPDAILKTVMEKCITGIEEVLPAFDLGWWSRYSLGIRWNLAPYYYHDIHIILLRHLGCVFNSTVFHEYADRWECYRQSFLYRVKRQSLGLLELNINRLMGVAKLNLLKYRSAIEFIE